MAVSDAGRGSIVRRSVRGVYAPAVGLAMLSALLLLPLMFGPLWRDEGTTFLHAGQHSIPAVLLSIHKGELTPPLYFLLEYFWVRVAGSSEFALRLPSLLAVAVAVGLLYDTGRRTGGRVAGYAAAACACIAPLSLFVATEARPYAMTLLLAAFALWLVRRLLETPRSTTRIAVLLAIALAALCWTHYTAWPAVVGFAIAAPAIGWGAEPRRRLPYLLAVLVGGATAIFLVPDFVFAAKGSVNIGPDPVGTDLFHRIDARFVWFNPLLIAEPVFVGLFFAGVALWVLRTLRSLRTTGLATENQFLIVCFSVVICGVGASVVRSVPTHHHLAAYAPAAWLIIGNFYARLAAWLGLHDIRSSPPWRKVALLALCTMTLLTLFMFPLTYSYERIPRSGSLPLVRELQREAGPNTLLIAAPDALSPSLKYYLDRDPTSRLRGIPTWSQPWYYGYVRDVDASQKRLLLDRITRAVDWCSRVAFAVDWHWKSFSGIDYDVARDVVREESRLHGVAFHRVFPGTLETMELVVLAPACTGRRSAR